MRSAGAIKAQRNADHQLAAIWLQALVELDRRKTKEAQVLYQQLVTHDEDIDTEQQASIAADSALLDVRSERREASIRCSS